MQRIVMVIIFGLTIPFSIFSLEEVISSNVSSEQPYTGLQQCQDLKELLNTLKSDSNDPESIARNRFVDRLNLSLNKLLKERFLLFELSAVPLIIGFHKHNILIIPNEKKESFFKQLEHIYMKRTATQTRRMEEITKKIRSIRQESLIKIEANTTNS